ncbi:hypothetical protein M3Y94_00159700 [Aphelenchoides besseyi]|nr:hypothetical protein M3Y94_00159700 [Aphelenchoides besseyi]KAI6237084.1 hypothetical protein M3Y95_00227700 [Aphelenchoides besseyi]
MSNVEVHSRRTSHPTAFRPWTTLPEDVIAKETVEPMGTDAVDRPHSLLSKLMAEAIGPMMLVFFGSLSALKSNSDNVLTHAAFAHGLVIFVMVNSLGHVSGGHFNPAVSLAAALAGKLHPYLVLPYWIVQLLGGFIGACLVRAVTQQTEFNAIMGGATILSPDDKWHQGLLAEAVLTFLLTFVVLNSAIDRDNVLAPLAIGFSLTICIFGAGSISGASMNPARSLGPCVAANLFIDNVDNLGNLIWNYHYIYWVGPFLGAAISALIYRSFFARSGRLLP